MSLIHSYSNAFKGFSAMLTEEEAAQLSGKNSFFLLRLKLALGVMLIFLASQQ